MIRFLVVSFGLLLIGCATPTRYARTGFEVHHFTHDSTNSQLVVKDGAAFLFDTGYEKNAALLEADVRAAGVDPSKLKAIVISHGHSDHAGAALYFHQRFGVPVIVGEGDQDMFAKGKMEPLCPTGLIGSLRHRGDEAGTYSGSVPDTLVGDTLELKDLTGIDAKVIHLAGHTNGSLIVVVGDVVLVGDLCAGASWGRAPRPTSTSATSSSIGRTCSACSPSWRRVRSSISWAILVPCPVRRWKITSSDPGPCHGAVTRESDIVTPPSCCAAGAHHGSVTGA